MTAMNARMSFSVANADRVILMCHSLARRNRWHRETRLKEEALELIQDQAREIMRLETERDDLLGVAPPDLVEVVDVVTEADAVAFITKVSNRWGARKQ